MNLGYIMQVVKSIASVDWLGVFRSAQSDILTNPSKRRQLFFIGYVIKLINSLVSGEIIFIDPHKGRFQMSNVTFIDVNLTVKQKKEVKASMDDMTAVMAGMESIALAGNKFTVKYDTRDKIFVAFCFGGKKTENDGLVIASRGKTLHSVFASLEYKINVVKKGKKWQEVDELDSDWFD